MELIGLLFIFIIIMLLVSILSVLNIFQKKLKHLLNLKTLKQRIQLYDSTMCGYFCIGFIDFMFNLNLGGLFRGSF